MTWTKSKATPELENFSWEEIEAIEEVGEGECYDLCLLEEDVLNEEPNYIANGFIVHNSGMHETYCNRKRGKESYEIHPALDFLKSTYGVLVYQESIIRILNTVGRIPLKDCETIRKAISKKKVQQFQKYKEMFISNGQEVLGWSEDKVSNLWRQVEAFAGYGFNLAHATAYTFISARQLYLKAHHPLAFYTSVIDGTHASGPKDYQKIKDYKMEATKHGVPVNPVNINVSKTRVSVHDGQIYWGFSKLRGIGEEVAQRIEKTQPYNSYEDFLHRFGTDAKANQAVLALRLFPGDPLQMYRLFLAYREWEKKNNDRAKRFAKTMANYHSQIRNLCQGNDEALAFANDLTEDNYQEIRILVEDCQVKQLDNLWRKVVTSRTNYTTKSNAPRPTLDTLSTNSDDFDEDFAKLLEDQDLAEETYYGFIWTHPLEKCKLYGHHTFGEFESDNNIIGPIDVMVKQVKKQKGPKATYYTVDVEDATGDIRRVIVWENDYVRFDTLLKQRKCIRMTVKGPDEGWTNFTLHGSGRRWPRFSRNNNSSVISIE